MDVISLDHGYNFFPDRYSLNAPGSCFNDMQPCIHGLYNMQSNRRPSMWRGVRGKAGWFCPLGSVPPQVIIQELLIGMEIDQQWRRQLLVHDVFAVLGCPGVRSGTPNPDRKVWNIHTRVGPYCEHVMCDWFVAKFDLECYHHVKDAISIYVTKYHRAGSKDVTT